MAAVQQCVATVLILISVAGWSCSTPLLQNQSAILNQTGAVTSNLVENDCMAALLVRASVDHGRVVEYSKLFAGKGVDTGRLDEMNLFALRLIGVSLRADRQKIHKCFSAVSGTSQQSSAACQPHQICSSRGNCSLSSTEPSSPPFYTCSCPAGYSGSHCQNDACVKYSEDQGEFGRRARCQHGGTCSRVESELGYVCECVEGYSGDECQDVVDNCHSKPCTNGGHCVNSVNQFECHCTIGYSGSQCAEKWLTKTEQLSRHSDLSKQVGQVGRAHDKTRDDIVALTKLVASLTNVLSDVVRRVDEVWDSMESMKSDLNSKHQMLLSRIDDVTARVQLEIGAVQKTVEQHEVVTMERNQKVFDKVTESMGATAALVVSNSELMGQVATEVSLVSTSTQRMESDVSSKHRMVLSKLDDVAARVTSEVGTVQKTIEKHETVTGERDQRVLGKLAENKRDVSTLVGSNSELLSQVVSRLDKMDNVNAGMRSEISTVQKTLEDAERVSRERDQRMFDKVTENRRDVSGLLVSNSELKTSVNGMDRKFVDVNNGLKVIGLRQKFVFYWNRKPWHQARDSCASLGGSLAMVFNEEENNYLENYLRTVPYVGDLWIGGSDLGTKGTFVWLTGATFWKDGVSHMFTDWYDYPTWPNPHPHRCLSITSWYRFNKGWVNLPCQWAAPYFCRFG